MKIFFDTNILVAATLVSHEKHATAFDLLNSAVKRKTQGFVAAHSLVEYFSVLTRLPANLRLSPQEAAVIIEQNFSKNLTLVCLDPKEYLDLLINNGKKGIAGGLVYDALILACAYKSSPDKIYTLNPKHFRSLARADIAAKIVDL